MTEKVELLTRSSFHWIQLAISDALDRCGIKGGCQGILPVVSGRKNSGSGFLLSIIAHAE